MPIHLYIPDPALHEAVVEQLKLAKFDLTETAAEATELIVDEAAWCDGLVLSSDRRSVVLALGALPPAMETQVTESFTKPLRLGHLLARLAFYRDTAARRGIEPVVFGPFRLDSSSRQLTVLATGELVRLTEKETALLDYLAQSPTPVPRDELLAAIWGYGAQIDTHTLETHVYQLRRKLDPDASGADYLIYDQGGYRLNRA